MDWLRRRRVAVGGLAVLAVVGGGLMLARYLAG